MHLEDLGGGRDAGQRVDVSYERLIGRLGGLLVEVTAQGGEPLARFLAEGIEHGARDAAIPENVFRRLGRRKRFGWRCGLGAFERAQALGFGRERGGLRGRFDPAGSDCLHPVGEETVCLLEQLHQRGGGRPLPLQPGIESLLQGPGALAELGETNHAATALEGVDAAAHLGERFEIVRSFLQIGKAALQGGEHFARFFEEDVEEFFFDRPAGRRLGLARWDRGSGPFAGGLFGRGGLNRGEGSCCGRRCFFFFFLEQQRGAEFLSFGREEFLQGDGGGLGGDRCGFLEGLAARQRLGAGMEMGKGLDEPVLLGLFEAAVFGQAFDQGRKLAECFGFFVGADEQQGGAGFGDQAVDAVLVEGFGRIAVVAIEQGLGFGEQTGEFPSDAAAVGFGGLGLDLGQGAVVDEGAQPLDLRLEPLLGALVPVGGAAVGRKDEERAGELELGLCGHGVVGMIFHPLDEGGERLDGLLDALAPQRLGEAANRVEILGERTQVEDGSLGEPFPVLGQSIEPLGQGVELGAQGKLGQGEILVFQGLGEPPVLVQQLLRPAVGLELGDGMGECLQEPAGWAREFPGVAHRAVQVVQDALGSLVARQTPFPEGVGIGERGQP